MLRRRYLLILSGVLSCGWLRQLVLAHVPTKVPPAARPGAPPQGDGREWIKPPPEGDVPDAATREVEQTEISASSAESVGAFWLGEVTEIV